MSTPSAAPIDLLSPASFEDPYAFFGRLREEDPVHFNAAHKSWVITRYDDVAAGFLDQRLSSNRVEAVYEQKLTEEQRSQRAPTYAVLSDWMVFKDPPAHTRLRNLVKRAFTPRAVQALAPRIEEVVDHVLDRAPSDAIDVVTDIAYPIPAMVIAEMLGVPAADRDLFRAWSNDITTLIFEGARGEEDRSRAQGGLVALSDYLTELVRGHRASPQDDLISALIRAEDHDESLTESEIVNTCVLLLFGGHETTTNLIANGFLALKQHPEQARVLLEHPEVGRVAPSRSSTATTGPRSSSCAGRAPTWRSEDNGSRRGSAYCSCRPARTATHAASRIPTSSTSGARTTATSPSASGSTTASGRLWPASRRRSPCRRCCAATPMSTSAPRSCATSPSC